MCVCMHVYLFYVHKENKWQRVEKKESVKQVPLTYYEHVFIVLKVRKNVVYFKNTQLVTPIHRTYFVVQHCVGGNSTSVSESRT